MNADSLSKGLENAQKERQTTQTQEALKILETLKNDFQSSLLAESQSFKSSIAATEKRLKWTVRLALAVTALAILCSSTLILVSVWTTHQMNSQAQLAKEQMEKSDPYLNLREQRLIPIGEPLTVKGRTVIELKKVE